MRFARGRHLLAAMALGFAAVTPPGAAAAGWDSTATAPVALTGQLVVLAPPAERAGTGVEPHPESATPADGQVSFLRLADHTLVPVDSSGVAGIAPSSTVTLHVVPPQPVAAAAARPGADPLDHRDAVVSAAVVSAEPLEVARAQVVREAATGYTPGAHQVYLAVVSPRGFPVAAASAVTSARRQVGEASRFWGDGSAGGVTFEVVSSPAPYVSRYTCAEPGQMWTEAATRLALPYSDADVHLVLVLPFSAYQWGGCSYGLGTLGAGVNSGGLSYVADTAWPVLAHELGHNLGLDHANRARCSAASDITFDANRIVTTPGCSVVAYGDASDVMGPSARDSAGRLSAVSAYRIGLLDDSDVVSVTSGTATVSLTPLGAPGGVRGVRVVDPRTAVVYVVEYRGAVGADLTGYRGREYGVRVLRQLPGRGASLLLDPSPTGLPHDDLFVLAPGATFTSASGGVLVRTRSVDAGSARVTVSAVVEPPLSARVLHNSFGRWSTASVEVSVSGSGTGGAPTGSVTLSTGATRLASSPLTAGRAVLRVPPMPVGSHALTVTYTPRGSAASTSTSVTLAVARPMLRGSKVRPGRVVAGPGRAVVSRP